MSSISEKLKAARLERKLTLEAIASELNIRKQYLVAIEEGEYPRSLGKAYITGYIRLYANYLHVNLEAVHLEVNIANDVVKVSHAHRPYIESSTPSKFYIILSIITVLVTACVWSMMSNSNRTMMSNNLDQLMKLEIPYTTQPLDFRYDATNQQSKEISERSNLDYFLNSYSAVKQEIDKSEQSSVLSEPSQTNREAPKFDEHNNDQRETDSLKLEAPDSN